MEWIKVSSIEELKKLGKFREVSNGIKEDVAGTGIKVTGRGWNDLWKSIQNFKDLLSKFCPESKVEVQENDVKYGIEQQCGLKVNSQDAIYFSSQAAEYIFYLVELDGEVRMDKLGITSSCFSNKRSAKTWREKISKVIHPDICHHLYASDAMSKLNELYAHMVGRD